MYINNDISRCVNKNCPLKENCARFLQTVIDEGKVFSYSILQWNKTDIPTCDFQIKITKIC